MKLLLSFLILFFSFGIGLNAQHLSIDFPLEIPVSRMGQWQQSFDLSGFPIQDFVAVSLVFEAEGLGERGAQCSMLVKGNWQEIPPFGEEAIAGRYVSELVFVPEEAANELIFRFQLKNEVESLKARLHVFSPTGATEAGTQGASNLETAQDLFCTCPLPDFVPRASWGAAFALNGNIYTPPAVYTTVTHLIVHHSAGTNTSNNWPGVVAAIFDYHVNTNGWSDIGYNWLIAPNGQLFEGRGGGDNVRGSHMCGYNNNTMGVCALGNYVNVPFPGAGMEALKKLLAWKSCKEDIPPLGNGPINSHTGNMQHISGHRDGCAPGYTECPGNMLYGQLAALRQGVEGYAESACQSVEAGAGPAAISLSLSPIPVSDQLELRIPDANGYIRLWVVDVLGRQVREVVVEAGESRVMVKVGQLPPGHYFIAADLDGRMAVGRFLKG